MTIVYVETSALIKKYIQKIGSLSISVLAALELKSALTRLVRGGRISESEMRVMLTEFGSHRPFFSIMLSVDNLLMDEAGELLEKSVLRALDAIHFASALRLKTSAGRTNESRVVVTSDLELVSAWDEEGLVVINPTNGVALEQIRNLSSGQNDSTPLEAQSRAARTRLQWASVCFA